MLSSCVLVAIFSAAPDAGARSVARTVATETLDAGADALALVVVTTERLRAGDVEIPLSRLEFTTRDGGTTAALSVAAKALNAELTPESRKEVEGHLLAGDFSGLQAIRFSTPLNRGPWLDVMRCIEWNGAYPSVECTHRRLRADTGAAWTWSQAIKKSEHARFLKACSKRLAEASARQRKQATETSTEANEIFEQFRLGPTKCTLAMLDDAERAPDSGLEFLIGRDLPHVALAFLWKLPLPPAFLAEFVDPAGPLGALAR